MSETEQKFIVFNYVTSRAQLVDEAPNFGDPNRSIQQEALAAYTGTTSGATSLSSATTSGPSVNEVATPAADLVAVAQASTAVSQEQVATIQQSLGGLDQVGQLPAAMNSMAAHADNVMENSCRIFDAIDLTFEPDQAGTPDRCARLGEFIGSVQGAYNGTIQGVTSGLGQITNSLLSVPRTIISAVTGTISAVITAIQSGVQAAIDSAIKLLSGVTNTLFGSLGTTIQGVINTVGSAVSAVQKAIQGEIDRVAGALGSVTNNLFRLVVPNVNPCMKSIMADANNSSYEIAPDWANTVPSSESANLARKELYGNNQRLTAYLNSGRI